MISNCIRAALAAVAISACVLFASTVHGAGDAPSNLSPEHAAAVATARGHIDGRLESMGLEAADVQELVVSDVYTSRHNSVTHVYFQQRRGGIDVYGALINVNVLADGEILNSGNRAYGQLGQRDLAAEPVLSARQALDTALAATDLVAREPIVVLAAPAGAARETIFSNGGVAIEPIPARLVYAADENRRLHLAWQVEIYERGAEHYWVVFVEAQSGRVIGREDRVVHDDWSPAGEGGPSAPLQRAPAAPQAAPASPRSVADGSSYRVFALPIGNPDEGARSLVHEPAHQPASPFGWHDTNGADGAEFTITRGNNVHAYQDRNDSDSSSGDEPDGGSGLSFDFALNLGQAPDAYIDAAVTNLFYWNNIHHDLSYVRGFDEAAGNFQVNNYGKGGAGGDAVRAEAQDGADVGKRNNANFMTPSDGSAPRMQMYLWDQTSPWRDGDLDAGIVLHEYGHGISLRLTGGPSTTWCLSGNERAGEGWSDWQTLVYTAKAGHSRTTNRGVGTYVFGQPLDGTGIRTHPYNTDMNVDPRTYGDTGSAAVPHGVGSIWAAILWEVYWNLVDEYGFNPDFYADWDQGGNLLAMQLVMDGLKLQPCDPGFVDARDAILAADAALTGGANQCRLWEAFAKRGLGESADQGSSSYNGDNIEAFDTPLACDAFAVDAAAERVCIGDSADFDLDLGQAWSDPVNLSASGQPGTATFSPNPASAPGSSLLTISDTAGQAPGVYPITVSGDDGSFDTSIELELTLDEQAPGTPALIQPLDDATQVSFRPELSWSAVPGAAGYRVEVATDPGFADIVVSGEPASTSWRLSSPLAPNARYYWRVTALNGCGAGIESISRKFTVRATSLACGTTIDFEEGIPGDWTISDDSSGGNGTIWQTTADAGCSVDNRTNGTGIAACADSTPPGGSTPAYDTSLVTPAIDFSHVQSASLDVGAYFKFRNYSELAIDINGGSGWEPLWSTLNTGAHDVALDLDDWAGAGAVQIRFRYAGDGGGYHAQVDDLALNCMVELPPSIAADRYRIDAAVVVDGQASQTLELRNTGDLPLNWSATEGQSCQTPGDLAWLTVTPQSGAVSGSHMQRIELDFDAGAMSPGSVSGALCLQSNDPAEPALNLPVNLRVIEDAIFGDCFTTGGAPCRAP